MKLLSAIGRALAALAMVIVEWVESLARFVVRCMPGYVPPNPDNLVEQYAEAVETAPVTPSADQRLENIRTIADNLFRGAAPDPKLAAGLSPATIRWLTAMEPEMLLAVSRAPVEDLQRHVRGERSIRGVLAYDAESVASYIKARESAGAEPDLEYHRRRPRPRGEPLLGPIA
jgi:hypothetical protein